MKFAEVILVDFERASQEAFMAQRLAELKNVAEYRKRHYQQIIELTDPVKRAAKQKEMEEERAESEKIFAEMIDKNPDIILMHKNSELPYKVTPLFRPSPKKSFLDKIKSWIKK